jgi:hypothetical protein
MQRDFAAVEYHEQLGLLFVQPYEQTVEGDESGLPSEDALESRLQERSSAAAPSHLPLMV